MTLTDAVLQGVEAVVLGVGHPHPVGDQLADVPHGHGRGDGEGLAGDAPVHVVGDEHPDRVAAVAIVVV